MQEALSNAVRHGARSRVLVELERAAGAVVLTVTDDGPGFSDEARSRLRASGGLAGIRERVGALGGAFSIENVASGGARVRVSIPTGSAAAASAVARTGDRDG
jgi:signal transduction histidine kinase